MKTINKFHEKYPTIPHEVEPLLKPDSDYEIELQQFISDRFEAWGWDLEEEHQILISTWAERLNDPDKAEKNRSGFAFLSRI